MADPAIAAEGLGTRFGDVTALDGVDLEAGRPTMFQIGRASDTEAALTRLLTRFARWSAARTALQTATLVVVAMRSEPHRLRGNRHAAST